jgi:hypothetical protein
MKMEISPFKENDWSLITIPYTEVYIDGFYFISYNGSAIDELECGAYDFKLTAGETWYFEPITVKDFIITENAYTIRDDLMLPFKFSEQQFETSPIIAPCDSFLPFMFSTENATSGTIAVYLYDADCVVTELTDIVVTVLTISGKTYYIHEGECFYPFLECGTYKLEIVDGTHSYFSVPFDAVCDMNDIPDGYRVMLDFNRCVMRDEDGIILYEECSDIPVIVDACDDLIIGSNDVTGGNSYAITDEIYMAQGFILDNSCHIDYIEITKGVKIANPNFNIRLSIYNSLGGLPTTKIIDSSNLITATNFCSGVSLNRFYFDYLLTNGNYCMVITYEDVITHNSTNYINVRLTDDGTYIDGAASYRLKLGVNWNFYVGYDIISKIVSKSYTI